MNYDLEKKEKYNYILNQENLQKGIQIFIDMTFRKKKIGKNKNNLIYIHL